MLKQKVWSHNEVVDALSHQHLLITILQSKLVRFEVLKDAYAADEDFQEI